MQSIPEVVAFIASLAFFFVFIYLMFTRYLRYRETMRMIERGLLTPRRKRSDGKELLRWGIIICAIGIGLGVGLAPLGSLVDGDVSYWGPWMVIGSVPFFFGAALILIHYVARPEPEEEREDTPDDQGW
jgi:hypothetical protein